MAYIYTQPNMTGGLDETLVEIAREVPAFPIGILLFIFGVILLGGMSAQKRKDGYSDTPMWAIIASLATFMVALMMTMAAGLITLAILGYSLALLILSGFWFFMSRGRNESA